MRKKLGWFVASLVTLFMIASPMIVKADLLQLDCDAYSKYVSVGSEFIYAIKVEKNNFNGTVTFDNAVLEVLKVETAYSGGPNNVVGGSQGTITHSVSSNQLTINHIAGDFVQDILVTFKVKSYPSDGTTTVKVKANNNMWFGEPYSTMTVLQPKECPTCPTCEKDEVSCPSCEDCEKGENTVAETDKETKNNETDNSNSKDILLYSSLGACCFLAVVVAVLAFRKK